MSGADVAFVDSNAGISSSGVVGWVGLPMPLSLLCWQIGVDTNRWDSKDRYFAKKYLTNLTGSRNTEGRVWWDLGNWIWLTNVQRNPYRICRRSLTKLALSYFELIESVWQMNPIGSVTFGGTFAFFMLSNMKPSRILYSDKVKGTPISRCLFVSII